MQDTLDEWPGRDQREPARSQPGWSVRHPLAEWLRQEGRSAEGKRVLDVGCGLKPYYPFFATAAEYVGLDDAQNQYADVHGVAERMPVPDGSFDIVLCTQVLEHVDDPVAAVRELHRVTAPGGRVLASTHGVMVFHPNPVDHWRWTHTGLELLFARNGSWAALDVEPGAGTTAAIAMLTSRFVHLLAKRAHVPWAVRPLIGVLNAVAEGIDKRVPALRAKQPGALFANLHVTAVKAT